MYAYDNGTLHFNRLFDRMTANTYRGYWLPALSIQDQRARPSHEPIPFSLPCRLVYSFLLFSGSISDRLRQRICQPDLRFNFFHYIPPSPCNIIGSASIKATVLGNLCVPPAPGSNPNITSGKAKVVFLSLTASLY